MKDRIACECCRQSVPKTQTSCQKRTILCAACMRVLSAAAFTISELPAGQQAGWVIWILEVLDSELPFPNAVPEYEGMLASARDAIDTRLESGGW